MTGMGHNALAGAGASALQQNKKYYALVVDKKPRFIRVRIPELHRGVPDDSLPWVKCDVSFGMSGNAPGMGSVGSPPKGSKVWVEFLDEAGYHPVYKGAAAQDDDITDELESDDEDAYGFVDPAGNRFFVSPEAKTVEFTHVSGTKILIAANGAVSMISANDVNIHANGALNLRGQTVNIDGASGVTVKGIPVNLNPGGGAAAPDSVTPREAPKKRDVTNKTDM